jgi:hypothetical protein
MTPRCPTKTLDAVDGRGTPREPGGGSVLAAPNGAGADLTVTAGRDRQLRFVCSWCAPAVEQFAADASHGICPACRERLLAAHEADDDSAEPLMPRRAR